MLVGPPGHSRLDEGNQCVRPLGRTVVEGQTRVVVVQAAIGDHTELASSRAGFQDTMMRDIVHGALPTLELTLGELMKNSPAEEVLDLLVVR